MADRLLRSPARAGNRLGYGAAVWFQPHEQLFALGLIQQRQRADRDLGRFRRGGRSGIDPALQVAREIRRAREVEVAVGAEADRRVRLVAGLVGVVGLERILDRGSTSRVKVGSSSSGTATRTVPSPEESPSVNWLRSVKR